MRMLRAIAALVFASLAWATHAARAVPCIGPLCGGFVQAAASGTGGTLDRIDVDGATAVQVLGPVYAGRLADVGNPSGEGNVSAESARLTIDLPAGHFAIEMGTTSDAHDFGANVIAGAASRIDYDEELAIGSASLPPGTDVTVRLRYRIAYGTALDDSLDASVVASFNYAQQYADVQIEATASLDDHLGSSDFDQSFWNVWYGLSSNVTGLFANTGQVGEVVASVKTGQNLRFHVYLNGGAGSQASVYGQFPPFVFPTAVSAGTVAMVFGLEADQPGVTITSPTFGAMPDFSGVTALHAVASALPVDVGGPVTVPEPGAGSTEAAAGIAVVALGACRERRRG